MIGLSVATFSVAALEIIVIPEVVEQPSGGYFPETWKYRKRPKDKEEKKALLVVEHIIDEQAERLINERIDKKITADQNIELILRLKLVAQEIEFKKLYLDMLTQEFNRIKKIVKRRKEEELIIMLLH